MCTDMKMCMWYSHLLEYHCECATLCTKAIWHKIYCTVRPVQMLKDQGSSVKIVTKYELDDRDFIV
jgi:hypothetical protein